MLLLLGHLIFKQYLNDYMKNYRKVPQCTEIKFFNYRWKEILPENCILNHILTDTLLLENDYKNNYNIRFQNNLEKKLCPYSNCIGYLLKKR